MAMSFERAIRKWIRANFKARIVHDENGFVMSVKGKTTKFEIQNPSTVLAHLQEKAKMISESAKMHSFTFQESKKAPKLSIKLSVVGDANVLTMVQ